MNNMNKGKEDKDVNDAVNEFREKYRMAQSAVLDAEIELSLAEQGIDVTKIAKRDFDTFHRSNIKIEEIKAKAQEKINRIQQEAVLEIQGVHLELGKLNNKIRESQGLKLLTLVENVQIHEPATDTNSQSDIPGAPESD
jgi:hypothetical protein